MVNMVPHEAFTCSCAEGDVVLRQSYKPKSCGATCHACKDRFLFNTFHPVQDGFVLPMGDESTKPILGHENVVLEFSFGKTITLINVVYVPGLRKSFMFDLVLNKCGYKQVYESDNYILLRNGVFVGFGYYNNDIFMLNHNKVPNAFSSVCMISSKNVDSSMWHARLGHVHYKCMLDMSKDNLIPEFDTTLGKYRTCMLNKITRQPFKDIKRDSKVLELIHIDLCDFYAPTSLGNKKYVVTFIDDESIFCYVYICHAKDEALDKLKIYKTKVELQQNDLIKTLHTDKGGGYYDPVYFQSVGIIHDTTAPYTAQQNEVINDEMDSIMENNTWILSYLPPSYKPLGCKWIFKRKMKVDGTIDKIKARLVIQGFRQKEGFDYFDTFATVARISIIRLLIALESTYNLVIHQMDGKTTFLMVISKMRYTSNSSTYHWHAIMRALKKQTCITESIMEEEFVALAAAGKEAEWLRNLIYKILLWPKPNSPISIHCDSAATLAKAYCRIYNEKSIHLGVRHIMVRELITNAVISVDFVRSQQNLADHLTKGLARDLVHTSAIGMVLKYIEISNDEMPNSLIANTGS
nr:zinc finger, CCHC-type [Tanacetum cinerariifolium]